MSTAEERMQNEIDELEQENRLLRARNERLEAELMQMQGRELKLQFALNAPVQEPAFYGFMDEEECCVNMCFTPHAPGGPNNELATAYYTSPHAVPVQEPDLAKSCREELDKLSQRNYELRMENAELKNTPSAAQRQWVGLTDEDRVEIYEEHRLQIRPIIEIVEAKLREKNGGAV